MHFEVTLYHFLSTYRPFDDIARVTVDTRRSRLVTFSIAQASVIQLYGQLLNQHSNSKCLEAAYSVVEAIVHMPEIETWGQLDPLMGASVSLILHSFLLTPGSAALA